jgi:CheY-like chemotaxis protein
MKKLNIIYAEDNTDFANLVKQLVNQDENLSIEIVTSGEELLSRVQKDRDKYNAVILDFRTGQNNTTGTIIANSLREKFPKLPIAILSNYDIERIKDLIFEKDIEVWEKISLYFSRIKREDYSVG